MAIHALAQNRTGSDLQESLLNQYELVRAFSEALCAPLCPEDYVIQSMEDVSPTKWHLAHTSWFFEAFILQHADPDYKPFNPQYNYLFNSYYNTIGEQFTRPERGLLSRPTVDEVYQYRHYVDEAIKKWLARASENEVKEWQNIFIIGLNHEQQHQELILTDIKHVLSINPLAPVYIETHNNVGKSIPEIEWLELKEGLYEIGHQIETFAYDNEGPVHQYYVNGVAFASRLVTNAEYLEFIEDGGYQTHHLWLSEAWQTIQDENWQAPFYWRKIDGQWHEFTLNGLVPLNPDTPVTHISYFEADAFARWAGVRLPREEEWEAFAKDRPVEGNFVEEQNFHPAPAVDDGNGGPRQLFGDVWEWTQSAYAPYPGYRATPDAVGEYNGKFMCNQYVLRGGSCATSHSHIRPTYRNFFPAHARWQFSGIRLVKDL